MPDRRDAQPDFSTRFPSVGDRPGAHNTVSLIGEVFLTLGGLIAERVAAAGFPQRRSHSLVFAHIEMSADGADFSGANLCGATGGDGNASFSQAKFAPDTICPDGDPPSATGSGPACVGADLSPDDPPPQFPLNFNAGDIAQQIAELCTNECRVHVLPADALADLCAP